MPHTATLYQPHLDERFQGPGVDVTPKRRAGTPQSYEAKIRRFGAIVQNVPPNVAGYGACRSASSVPSTRNHTARRRRAQHANPGNRSGARDCGRYVSGEYRFETPHGSHWMLDEQPDAVADLLLDWFGAHPI